MNPYYTDYSEFLSRLFPGIKVQKISVSANLGCPNRDGSIGTNGCTYCNNASFNPSYCRTGAGITEQIEAGKNFFRKKYPAMKYLAYFQAYTNTYGEHNHLLDLYNEAIAQPDVVGLIIGTRPDCLPDRLLQSIAEINRKIPVIIELGAESMHDRTLQTVNRRHTSECTRQTAIRVHEAGLSCGLHLIAGLPGESMDDMMWSVEDCCRLPIDTLKLHQLQLIKGTRLAEQVACGELEVTRFTVEEYIDLCIRIISTVPRSIAIERFVSQSPPGLLAQPGWGIKNYEFTNMLNAELKKLSTESDK